MRRGVNCSIRAAARTRSCHDIIHRILIRWHAVLAITLAARTAIAEPSSGELLARGIQAFGARDYENAATRFESALSRGAMSPPQTLTAYTILGATLVALGRTRSAEHAFEQAALIALIDRNFVLPPSARRDASALAAQARHQQEELGTYHLDVGPPGEGEGDGAGSTETAGSGKPAGNSKPAGSDEGETNGVAETGPWSIPHGAKRYTATRAERAPKIDGVLDDAIWQTASRDDRFLSTKSKPFGMPAAQPTVVQIAYDDKNLYVAFRCNYARLQPPSDAFAGDEKTMLGASENVSVAIDATHGHTGGYQFAVSPAGARADAEISAQGEAQNLDWHGIWDVGTAMYQDGWTAEFSIPWGTMNMSASDAPFDVGIEFKRYDLASGEIALWALHPPATDIFDTNLFGHLDGLAHVHPGQRMLFLPYTAAAFDSSVPAAQPSLSDLTGTDARGRIYAGAYLRVRPPGPFRLDATLNPDFSAVDPDQAAANFDRFELEHPESRPFFAEDAPRFQFGGVRYTFGDLGAQLFYSRRLGIATDVTGFTQVVPILWGVKSVFQDGGTEAAVMNIETIKAQSGLVLNDNATIGRVNETIEGQRVGAIVLACQTCGTDDTGAATRSYVSGGPDLQLALLNRHLLLSGFWAGTRIDGKSSAAGEGTAAWRSQDIYLKSTLLDIGKGFQAPLGFFATTGVRAETVAVGYSPLVHADHVQQVFLEAQLSQVRDRDRGDLLYKRSVIAATVQTTEFAQLGLSVSPATEVVTEMFPIGNGKILVPPGTYHVTSVQVDVFSPPSRTYVLALHYSGGDLFDGVRNAPGATVGLNLGRLTARANYALNILKFPDQSRTLYEHGVSFSASYAYSPLARTLVVLTADTVAARASALVTTALQFGKLSAVTLSMRGASGSTFDQPAMNTFDNATFTAVLSFQLGISPF